MNRLILHFGMPKTGSTSIQRVLFQELADPRFHYLVVERPNASYLVQAGFGSDPASNHVNRKMGKTAEEVYRRRHAMLRAFRKELHKAAGKVAILSAESLTQVSKRALWDLADFIRAAGFQIQAVGYIRPPKSFMESMFQQRIKGGLDSFTLTPQYPSYRASFEKFETVLGRENVAFWLFEPSEFPSGSIANDFCERLGIPLSGTFPTRANLGLSRPALSLLYAYRKFGPGYGRGPEAPGDNYALIGRLSGLGGPKVHLHSSLVRPILEAHADDIAWMESRLQRSLCEDLVAHDDSAIRTEDDLLSFEPASIQWLQDTIGPDAPLCLEEEVTPQQVAAWVHLLRKRLAVERAGQRWRRPLRRIKTHARAWIRAALGWR